MRPQPRMQNKKALTVSFALFPVTGLCCHRRLASTAKLDASVGASEPHDFAVHLTCCSSAAPSASIASRPAFVTIASRPSVGRDGGVYNFDLGQIGNGIFLQMRLDSPNQIDPSGEISVSAQLLSWANPPWAERPAAGHAEARSYPNRLSGSSRRPADWVVIGIVARAVRRMNQSENTNVMSRNFSTGRFLILRCISEMFTPSPLTTLASATVIGAEKKNSVKPNAIRITGTIKIA